MWIRQAFLISFYTLSIGGSFWVKDPMKMFALIWGYYSFKAEMVFSKCSIPARFLDLSILHEKTRKPRHFLQKNENGECFTVHCQFLCNHAFLNSANYTVLHERWSWCSWQIPRRLQGYSQFDQGLGIVWSKFEPNLFTTCPSSFDDKSTQHPSPRLKMIFFQTRPVRPFAWPGSIHF